jgi:hypothetical protein
VNGCQLMRRRWFGEPPYRQVLCGLCHRRLWPWQRRIKGANYYPHPFALVHPMCAVLYDPNLRGALHA